MITLRVPGYCQNCNDFEPETIKHTKNINTLVDDYDKEITDTYIFCVNREKCRSMFDFLIKEAKDHFTEERK